ncbi:MAG TPA: penicillin-binding transpeptidase domain-containing protein, partial [Caulobacterales bacterium]|nr:penicillin-binding transpeptidase domain-containing protein [Caulobacterales bacterium]
PARQDTAAKARAKIVLDEMLNAGYITAQQRAAALKAPLAISRSNPNGNLGYFRDWIDPQLNRVIGDQRDDFIIETTLDLEAQRAGEHALDAALDADGKLRDVGQGALLSMDSTGGVRAMVGGRSYGTNAGQSEFNRTTQSRRAPGSSFKYFIYMTAMAMGYTPWTVRVDQPIVIGDWAPGNYENKFYGPVTLTEAYAKSLNMVAIEVAHEVGGENVIATAQKLGVKTKLYNYRSLALGAQGLSLMEMVTSYGAMANDGVPIEPHGITRIRRASGQVLWAYRAPKRDPAIDERTKRLMNYLGSRVVQAGTGTRARIDGRDIAGKTGTSNDYRDAWFMGYVPGLVTGVWMGNDDYAPMKRVTGGSIPTQVWHDFMTVALRDVPYRPLDLPREEDMPQTTVVDATSALPPLVPAAAPMGAPLRPPSLPTEDLPPPPSRGGDG